MAKRKPGTKPTIKIFVSEETYVRMHAVAAAKQDSLQSLFLPAIEEFIERYEQEKADLLRSAS